MSLMEFLEAGHIPSGWTEFFSRPEVQKQLKLISEDLDEIRMTKTIYPSLNQVFRAFYMVPVNDVKAVIIGQDPYHNGSAVGLCFSVRTGNPINPSLQSIYKELRMEGFKPVEDGNLLHWARQGVLLLNMALTVEKGDAGSHSCMWDQFSELLVKYIAEKRGDNVHWLLFGKEAHAVTGLLKTGKFHCTSHPVPMAAYKACSTGEAFMGSNVFKTVPGVKW